jgi:hypothetical protein
VTITAVGTRPGRCILPDLATRMAARKDCSRLWGTLVAAPFVLLLWWWCLPSKGGA